MSRVGKGEQEGQTSMLNEDGDVESYVEDFVHNESQSDHSMENIDDHHHQQTDTNGDEVINQQKRHHQQDDDDREKFLSNTKRLKVEEDDEEEEEMEHVQQDS